LASPTTQSTYPGNFTGILRCSFVRCKETIAVAGDYVVEPDVEDDGHTTEFDFFRLRYATPALDIIVPPKGTPDSVASAIKAADKLLWIDPSAAANRLRTAVEELLTVYGLWRFKIENHKQKRLTAQQRITEFKKYESAVGEALEAVKWIGNHGSHEDSLTVADVLDGAEILAYALRIFYDRTEEEIERRVKTVNKRRGLPKRAPKRRDLAQGCQSTYLRGPTDSTGKSRDKAGGGASGAGMGSAGAVGHAGFAVLAVAGRPAPGRGG
jgi:hypothetical protein